VCLVRCSRDVPTIRSLMTVMRTSFRWPCLSEWYFSLEFLPFPLYIFSLPGRSSPAPLVQQVPPRVSFVNGRPVFDSCPPCFQNHVFPLESAFLL